MTITRAQAKSVRGLFSRALELSPAQLPRQAVTCQNTGKATVLRAQQGHFAIEYQWPSTHSSDNFSVPLQLFKEVEANRQDDVTIQPTATGGVSAHWSDGLVPKSWTCEALASDDEVAFPGRPDTFLPMPPDFLPALVEAAQTTDCKATRYALGCVQLTGAGEIVATDGRQLLRQTGFVFPWTETLLIHISRVIASKELTERGVVELGVTRDHVVLRLGSWTVWLAIEKEARFPNTEQAIPALTSAHCRVELPAAERRFLAENLTRLPQASQPDAPVTLEINGHVVIRAADSQDQPPTELELSPACEHAGEGCWATNRRFLQRAMTLGLPTLHKFSDSVFLGHDARRQYVWMGLDESCIVPASPHAIRISSTADKHAPPSPSPSPTKSPRNNPMRSTPNEILPPTTAEASPRPRRRQSTTTSLSPTAIEQALQLHAKLRETLQATAALVRTLRQQKKQERLFKSTLASLRELQNVS